MELLVLEDVVDVDEIVVVEVVVLLVNDEVVV